MNKPIPVADFQSDTAVPDSAADACRTLTAWVVDPDHDGTGLALVAGTGWSGSARRAPACLVQPMAGDRVMMVRASDGALFVLAVLERPDSDALCLTNALGGEIAVKAEALSLDGQTMAIDAQKGRFAIQELTVVGRVMRTIHDIAESVSRRLSWAADTATGSAETYVRTTKGTDIVSGTVISRRASSAMTHESAQAVINATGEMRLNAERIDMG
ncbi:MAG: DUF3540 domain-containing protein [Pseudomonadota bacterium]